MSASSKKKLRKEQNAAALTEKQLQQKKEAKKLKSQTITFVVIIALVLAIGIGSLAVTAYKNSGIIERTNTALTIGEHKLSAADLSYFYYDVINSTYNEWYEAYGDSVATYVSLFYGLDLSKPLNEQMYDEENEITYAEYFVDSAVQQAVNAYAIYDLAVAEGKHENDDAKQIVDVTMQGLELNAMQEGYRNVTQYLKSRYGNGATEKAFRKYVEVLTAVDTYKAETYNALTYTDTDLSEYNDEHFYEFSSYSYATFYVSLSDLLVCTADESESGHQHTEEEHNDSLMRAEAVVEAIKGSNVSTVEELNAFIKTLDAYKEDENAVCTESKDVLYTDLTEEDEAEWLSDPSRKAGDLTVFTKANESTNELGQTVSVPYGFDVVMFQGRNDNEMKLVNVRHILEAFTDATTDEMGNTVYPDSSKLKARDAIEKLQETWVNGGKGEEAFAALATENTDDGGSAQTGGLYEDVYPGQMVSAFNDWCFNETRAAGDYGIVETEYGYHLMYFVGHDTVTFRNYMIENTMRNNDYNAWYQEQVDAAKYTVHDTSMLKQDISMLGY